MNSSTSNALIQVDPLEFILPVNTKEVEFSLRIINITEDYVAFHVGYLLPKQYTGTPKKGILSPRSNVVIDITRSADGPHAGSDSVFVRSTIVSKNFKISDTTYDWFLNLPAGSIAHAVVLQVILVAPSRELRSWEITPYSIPSLSPIDKRGGQKSNFEKSLVSLL